MKKLKIALIICCLSPFFASAASQCGPFFLKGENDGRMHINGQAPETQKMTFLKQKDDFDNVKMQWMLQDAKIGRWLGLDYIKRNKKAILNVEVIRTNMNEPRRFWSIDGAKLN